jgi:hypothetical protein
MNPAHTIGGTRGVRGVLGEGGVSLVRRVCPHALRGGTSADVSKRFAIVAAVLGGLWWFYLRREWQARVFGNAVAHASEHPVRLRRQNRELAYVNGNNNITGVDLGRGGVVWFRQFLGRGRNGMCRDVATLFGSAFLVYVEPKPFFCFRTGKFSSAAPSRAVIWDRKNQTFFFVDLRHFVNNLK